jgi:hypothetical protein
MDSLNIGSRPPDQALVTGTGQLELKQPLAASQSHSGSPSSKHGAAIEPLTIGYSGFVEAILVVSECLHPLPWVACADKLSLLLGQFERNIPEVADSTPSVMSPLHKRK